MRYCVLKTHLARLRLHLGLGLGLGQLTLYRRAVLSASVSPASSLPPAYGRRRLRPGVAYWCAAYQGDRDDEYEYEYGMGKKKYFAVARGRRCGVFDSWAECERQVKGFRNNMYQGFASEADAAEYLRANGVHLGEEEKGERQRQELDWGESDSDSDSGYDNSLEKDKDNEKEKETPTVRRALMFFDGASKRNPGDAGFGAVIFDRDNDNVVKEVKGFMPSETNNVAEYSGLIAGLEACLDIGVRDVHVKGFVVVVVGGHPLPLARSLARSLTGWLAIVRDSKLVIKQVNNEWQVRNENLMRYHRVARSLADRFERFQAEHVYRENNTHADRLSNEAVVERRPWSLDRLEGEGEGGRKKRKERDDE